MSVFVKEIDLYMKATGIVRRIDDLGRVVIPKEIRRTLRIREGDPLEIFTDRNGEVIFKKYSPLGELSEIAVSYCNAMAKGTDLAVIICDRDHCVAAGGIPKKEVLERRISSFLEDIMESRRPFFTDDGKNEKATALEGVEKYICAAMPVLASGDICGAVVLLCDEPIKNPSESDIKLLSVAGDFLGKSLEEY